MARKTIFGKCRLCHLEKELNFEHIPPKCAFNSKTRFKKTNIRDIIDADKPLNPNIRGKLEQGGIGQNSFCESCNNYLGLNYVNEYKNWAMVGAYILSQGDYVGYEFDIKINPNQIIKQIVSMFLGINDESFSVRHKELAEFVKNPDSRELDDKYQIFTYLNNRGKTRHLPLMVSMGTVISASEITFPPFGYILTINSPQTIDKPISNITAFKKFNPKESSTIELKLNKLETHLPFVLDYRSKKEIEEAIKGNK